MALTDIFVTQFLLQETEATVDGVCWRELDSGGYQAQLNGVTVLIEQSHTRAGAFLCLTIVSGAEKIYITEPRSTSIIGRKYASEDERTLAELLRTLMKGAAAQCEQRRRRSAEQAEEIRQDILQRLVFGQHVGSAAGRAVTSTDE